MTSFIRFEVSHNSSNYDMFIRFHGSLNIESRVDHLQVCISVMGLDQIANISICLFSGHHYLIG